MKKRYAAVALAGVLAVAGCSEASTASDNISRAAENFEVDRRIVFINGITDEYLLSVEGKCSTEVLENNQLQVTCKTGDDEYWRHTLGLSDNVTFLVEQTEPAGVSGYHHRIIFRPETIIPNVDIETEGN